MISKTIKLMLASSLLSMSAYAYDASKVDVIWTGYKTQAKAPVSGTFDKVGFEITKNDDFAKFLSSAKVSIDPYSINSKMKFRDNNISSTLFKVANITEIKAVAKNVSGDESKGKVDVEITMNNVSKVVAMDYMVEGTIIKAKGDINVLDFAMDKSLAAFAEKCKPFHAGKTWADVTVAFDLPFTK